MNIYNYCACLNIKKIIDERSMASRERFRRVERFWGLIKEQIDV